MHQAHLVQLGLIPDDLMLKCSKVPTSESNDLGDDGQGNPFSLGVESNARHMFGVNSLSL